MFEVKLLFPGKETFNSNRGKGSEFWPFENFFGLFHDLNLSFVGSSFDQVLKDPQPGFFNDVINDGFASVLVNKIFNLFGDSVKVVSSKTGNGFNVVLEGSFGVGFSILEMD